MKLSQFIRECESFPYSKEYFELYKEGTELEIVELYHTNFCEDGNNTQTDNSGFFSKIWNWIKNLFTRFFNWVKSIFSSKKQKEDVDATNDVASKIAAAPNKAATRAQIAEAEERVLTELQKKKMLPLLNVRDIHYVANYENITVPEYGDIPGFDDKPEARGMKSVPQWLYDQIEEEFGSVDIKRIKKDAVILLTVELESSPYKDAISISSLTKMMKRVADETKGINRVRDSATFSETVMNIVSETLAKPRKYVIVELGEIVYYKNQEEIVRIKEFLRNTIPDSDSLKATSADPDKNLADLSDITRAIGDTIQMYDEIYDAYHTTINFLMYALDMGYVDPPAE